MKNEEFANFAAKKAFEIAYAVHRLSGHQKNSVIAELMEKDAIYILRECAEGNFNEVILKTKGLEYTARLGVEIGSLSAQAGALLLAEVKTLQTAISKFGTEKEVDLKDIFKKQLPFEKAKTSLSGNKSNQTEEDFHVNGNEVVEDKNVSRQTAILDFIRQNGNCRLKEIQESLRGVSERTVRYDIQKLLEAGSIERVGGGGPFSYYRVPGSGTESYPAPVSSESSPAPIVSV